MAPNSSPSWRKNYPVLHRCPVLNTCWMAHSLKASTVVYNPTAPTTSKPSVSHIRPNLCSPTFPLFEARAVITHVCVQTPKSLCKCVLYAVFQDTVIVSRQCSSCVGLDAVKASWLETL